MNTPRSLFLSALLLVALTGQGFSGDITLSADSSGITVNAGDAGSFVMPAPKLLLEEGGAPTGEVGKLEVMDEKTLVVKFAQAEAIITVNEQDASVTYSFEQTPPGVRGLRVLMVLPISLAEGGKFGFGSDPLKPFPAAKGETFLTKTSADKFHIVSAAGSGITVLGPQVWQELQDNRAYGVEQFIYAVYLKAETPATLRFIPYAP